MMSNASSVKTINVALGPMYFTCLAWRLETLKARVWWSLFFYFVYVFILRLDCFLISASLNSALVINYQWYLKCNVSGWLYLTAISTASQARCGDCSLSSQKHPAPWMYITGTPAGHVTQHGFNFLMSSFFVWALSKTDHKVWLINSFHVFVQTSNDWGTGLFYCGSRWKGRNLAMGVLLQTLY